MLYRWPVPSQVRAGSGVAGRQPPRIEWRPGAARCGASDVTEAERGF